MATRSGKRIRSMSNDSTVKDDVDITVRSERKVRNKLLNGNADGSCINVIKCKKRSNYVRYPTDDEQHSADNDLDGIETKQSRSTRKNTLKDRNTISVSNENTESFDAKKLVRITRRTKKASESSIENVPVTENMYKREEHKTKNKKCNKKHSLNYDKTVDVVPKKTKSRKKKGKKSTSIVESVENENFNKGNLSTDSFHSASESPTKTLTLNTNKSIKEAIHLETNLKSQNEPKSETILKDNESKPIVNENIKKNTHKKKSSIKEKITDTTFDYCEIKSSPLKQNTSIQSTTESSIFETHRNQSIINTTYDKNDSTDNVNVSYEKANTSIKDSRPIMTLSDEIQNSQKSNNSQILNTTAKNRKSEFLNNTFDKESSIDIAKRKSSLKNSTFDKSCTGHEASDITFEVLDHNLSESSKRKSSVIKKYNKLSEIHTTAKINNELTNENLAQPNIKPDEKLNTTFDKTTKTSLLSTDSENDVSRISITSDDSSITPLHESNIIKDSTLVLIESSMDESLNIAKDTLVSQESVTPLKREGTFTKDGPELDSESKKAASVTPKHTPVKRMSLPSPGSTPFPNKSSQKDRLLNITRSIEKSRRSSLVEVVPRTTKVMFCSPVDNPTIFSQQRKKVIKSNLKGSNKSFVVEENELKSRSTARKRSYTQSDAEDARAKRKRVTETAVEPARKRTFSASAKLSELFTPQRMVTPSKPKPNSQFNRTKLPNFAALHQKQFDKMESLDECQERKAKRAKQLLTPTGSVGVSEKISPKASTTEQQKEQQKQKASSKKNPYDFQVNPESKPGYTRFGFKLNMDVNPFCVPTKNINHAKASKLSKPNGLIRQATLPSLTGTTSTRKETAKQLVMREKSFTDKRTGKIQETRTVIKGVRTNRRFDLQMRLRNLN